MSEMLLKISDVAVRGPDLFSSAKFQTALETLAGKAAIHIGGGSGKDDGKAVLTEAVRPDWRKGLTLARPLLRESPDLRLLITLLHSILADQSQLSELGLRLQYALGIAELIAELLTTRWSTVHPLAVDEDGEPDTGARVGSLVLLGDKVLTARPIAQHCLTLLSSGLENGWKDRDLRIFLDRMDIVVEQVETKTRESSPEDQDFRYGELREVLQQLRLRLPAETVHSAPVDAVSDSPVVEAPAAVVAPAVITGAAAAEFDAVQGLTVALNYFEASKPEHLLIGLLKIARTQAGKRVVSNQRELCVEVLEQVASYIENTEPSSPVPLLLRRAISIHGKSFLELLASFGGTPLIDMVHDSKLIPKPPVEAKPK